MKDLDTTTLKTNAEQGDPEAQYYLGLRYIEGDRVIKDENKGFLCLRRAADQGHVEAQYMVGNLLHNWKFIDESGEQARHYLQRAGIQGHAKAQYRIGEIYWDKEARGKAVESYLKAKYFGLKEDLLAEAEEKIAIQALAVFKDITAEQVANNASSERLYIPAPFASMGRDDFLNYILVAVRNGTAEDCYHLGKCYQKGLVVTANDQEAFRWFEISAMQSYPPAQYSLGKCYWEGRGVEQDQTKGFEWFKKASDKGNTDAMFSIGQCFQHGLLFDVSEPESLKWFLMAAQKGHSEAQHNVALYLELGIAVKDNNDEIRIYDKSFNDRNMTQDLQANSDYCLKMNSDKVDEHNEQEKKIYWEYVKNQYINIGLAYSFNYPSKEIEEVFDCCNHEKIQLNLIDAEKGDTDAQYARALALHKGSGMEQNDALAVDWYRKAAEGEHRNAQFNLAIHLWEGLGVKKDKKESLNLFALLAESGLSEAQHLLGIFYAIGLDVEQKDETAVKFYRKAAKKQHLDALCCLGLCLAIGRGVGEDSSEAIKCYRMAAENNHSIASYLLGRIYQNGKEIAADKGLAVDLFQRALSGNGYSFKIIEAECAYNLGLCYQEGDGVDSDTGRAFECFMISARRGHVDAQYAVARYYDQDKVENCNEEDGREQYWYQKAAEQGHAESQYRLGLIYWNNRDAGICNLKKAKQLFERNVRLGHRESQYYLARCYEEEAEEEDPPDNFEDAEDYRYSIYSLYKKAAEGGHIESQYKLGMCYKDGYGCTRDGGKALHWFGAAAENRHSNAQFKLGQLYENGYVINTDTWPELVCPDIDKALIWYSKAAENGHAEAQYHLGLCCEQGNGVEQNKSKAIYWYCKAARGGLSSAESSLIELYDGAIGEANELRENTGKLHTQIEKQNSEAERLKTLLSETQEAKTNISHWPRDTSPIKWLIESASLQALGICESIGTTGSNPYPEKAFDNLMQGLGFETLYPGKATSVVVVGRESLEMSKLEECIDLRDNLTTKIYSQEMFLFYLMTGKDPFDAPLEILYEFAKGHPVLEELMEMDFEWPAIHEREPSDEGVIVIDGQLWHSQSPLTAMGYHVGKTGLGLAARRTILGKIMNSKLSFPGGFSAEEKTEWGLPGTSKRLKKIVDHIAFNINFRSTQTRYRHAINDWKLDLEWLKKTYYQKTKSRFRWPGV